MTIEERAMAFGKMLRSNGETEESYTSAMAGYNMGATDQKKIDIAKACEWWNKLTVEGSKSGIGFPVTQGWIAEFRKAMEEQL